MLRRLAIGLGLLLVPLIGISLWVATHRTDLPAPPDDADLAISLPELADGDNGFAYIVRADELSTLSFEDDAKLRALLSGSERDDAWLQRALRENRAALAELERAIAAPEIVFPEVSVVVNTDAINPLVHATSLARLANLDSRRLRAKGDRAAAFERSLLGVRLGAAAMRARNPQMVSSMLAMSLQNISLREARLALAELPIDAAGSLRLSRELERNRISPDAWWRTWTGEYAFAKATSRSLHEPPEVPGPLGLLPASFLWQPNRTLVLYGDRYRDIARAFAEPCVRGRAAFAAADNTDLLAAFVRGNGAGSVLISGAMPNLEKFNFRRCHNETCMALLEVEIALRGTGALPDPLPQDPFDGAPLRYDRARGLVYSIGRDFADAPVTGPPSPDDELEPAIYVSGARVAAP